MALVPIYGRGGVVAHAIVDDTDEAALLPYRWRLGANGYAKRHGEAAGRRVTVYMHRQILGLAFGDATHADHVNGSLLDNRRCNLRLASHAENMQNRRANTDGSSRFRGVHWDAYHGRWRAVVRHEGRARHIGYFAEEVRAAVAAEAFRAQHMPFAMPDPVLAAHLANRPTGDPIADDGHRQEIAA